MTRLNDNERNMWIDNDESLYLWWKRSRLSKRNFIKENRLELDAIILEAINKPPQTPTYCNWGFR